MNFITLIGISIAILIITQLYFFKKLSNGVKNIFPSVSPRKLKYTIIILIFIINMYPVSGAAVGIYTLINEGTRTVAPQSDLFDYFFVFPFWISFLIIVQSILILVLTDIFRLVGSIFNKKFRKNRLFFKITLIVIIFSTIYVPIRVFYDYKIVSTRIVEYQKAELPDILEGFKIVLISDMQADRYTNSTRLQNFINTVNEINADLVLIAGDVITNTPFYIDKAAEYLGKIESKYGVYSCVGDHDNWAYRGQVMRSRNEVIAALAKQNVFMIDNDIKVIEIDTAKVNIAFITNTYSGRVQKSTLEKLTNGSEKFDLKIFLTHQPRDFLIYDAKNNNYDLMFAGHTHGGQISFLFPFINITPTLIETKYVKGDFWFDNMLLIVNRGLGMSLAPLRYNSTPEVTVINLTGK